MEWVRGSPEGVELRALCKGSFGGQERPHCEAGAERRNRPRKGTIYIQSRRQVSWGCPWSMPLGDYSVRNNTIQVVSLFCQYLFFFNVLETIKRQGCIKSI